MPPITLLLLLFYGLNVMAEVPYSCKKTDGRVELSNGSGVIFAEAMGSAEGEGSGNSLLAKCESVAGYGTLFGVTLDTRSFTDFAHLLESIQAFSLPTSRASLDCTKRSDNLLGDFGGIVRLTLDGNVILAQAYSIANGNGWGNVLLAHCQTVVGLNKYFRVGITLNRKISTLANTSDLNQPQRISAKRMQCLKIPDSLLVDFSGRVELLMDRVVIWSKAYSAAANGAALSTTCEKFIEQFNPTGSIASVRELAFQKLFRN